MRAVHKATCIAVVALFVIAPNAYAGGGKGYSSLIGTKGTQGVSATAKIAFPVTSQTSPGVAHSNLGDLSESIVLVRVDVNNRCSATNLGGGFSYSFATG